MPFALIPIGLFKSPVRFRSMAKMLWGDDYVCGLDAREATYKKLRGDSASAGIIVFGPEGDVLWRGSDPHKGSHFYPEAGRPKVPFADLKKGISAHLKQGLLAGLDIPIQADMIAKAIKCGQLAQAQAYLSQVPKSGALGEFRTALETRFEELRKKKLAHFEELQKAGKDWDAYKVGSSYARCFPRAKDAMKIKSTVRKLAMKKDVRDNLDAKRAFANVVPRVYGSKGKASLRMQAKPALRQIAAKYPKTEFGGACAAIVR